jgi:hypothetical protein
MRITVTAHYGAWTVFARLNTGVVGSNPTRGTNVCVCLFRVYAVMCVGSGLVTGWSPVQGIPPSMYRFTKLKKVAKAQERAVEPLVNAWMNEWRWDWYVEGMMDNRIVWETFLTKRQGKWSLLMLNYRFEDTHLRDADWLQLASDSVTYLAIAITNFPVT